MYGNQKVVCISKNKTPQSFILFCLKTMTSSYNNILGNQKGFICVYSFVPKSIHIWLNYRKQICEPLWFEGYCTNSQIYNLKKKKNSSLWSNFILSMKKALFYIWNSIVRRNHLKTASFILFMIQSVKPLQVK